MTILAGYLSGDLYFKPVYSGGALPKIRIRKEFLIKSTYRKA